MRIYVLLKKHGTWPNGSSEPIVKKLCTLIDLKEELVYRQGKPFFLNSKVFLSVAHSFNLMVIAFSDQPIGIDLEKNRPLSVDLIERMHLDFKEPLQDWCQREATIKLTHDSDYLYKKAPQGTNFSSINVFDGYTCVLASSSMMPTPKIHYIDEETLTLI